jgi:S-adenosylmethionine hydrolase
MSCLITLTTDFGTQDHYVGVMKGVILNINPAAQFVDICHSIQSYDVLEAALAIGQSYSYFPAGTIHVVVVDPGVGTARRPLLVESGKYKFIGPDNGVLSFVYDQEERITVRHITAEHYFLHPVSATFHGRDIFAPVAAYASKGVSGPMFGEEVQDPVRFTIRPPQPAGDNSLRGVVLRVDKFGNLVTNFRAKHVPRQIQASPAPFRKKVGQGEIRALKPSFAGGEPGEVFAIMGSMGFLEIVTNRGSAANSLKAGKGSEVSLVIGE